MIVCRRLIGKIKLYKLFDSTFFVNVPGLRISICVRRLRPSLVFRYQLITFVCFSRGTLSFNLVKISRRLFEILYDKRTSEEYLFITFSTTSDLPFAYVNVLKRLLTFSRTPVVLLMKFSMLLFLFSVLKIFSNEFVNQFIWIVVLK